MMIVVMCTGTMITLGLWQVCNAIKAQTAVLDKRLDAIDNRLSLIASITMGPNE